MKVRILRQASGHVNGLSLRHDRPNHVYEVPPTLANYLVAQRLALFEMRDGQLSVPPNNVERRRGEDQARDDEYSS